MRELDSPKGRPLRVLILFASCWACALAAHAADVPFSVGGVYGYGDGIDVYGVQAAWSPPSENAYLDKHDLGLRLTAQIARWVARENQGKFNTPADLAGPRSLTDGNVMAELRYWLTPAAPMRPFVEAGFGFHLLSSVHIGGRDMATAFNFGSQAAAGFLFGENARFELSALIHHVSNANIKQPNWGMTYGGIRLRVALP